MSDNRATPITPTEEGRAGWAAEMGNSAQVIKRIKQSSNLRRQSPEADSSNAIELPQPIFREVPVHVSRAPNRSAQAIPPPSSQPQAPPSRRKDESRRRHRRLGGNGDGDGSDSDSGGDGRRNGRHSPDGPLQKRKPLQPQAEPSSQSTPSLKKMLTAQKPMVLSPEEQERLQTLKRLRAFEKASGDALELRRLRRAKIPLYRENFLQKDKPLPAFSMLWDRIEIYQEALNEYLDRFLYSTILDDGLISPIETRQIQKHEKKEVIRSLIAETESRVIEILKSILYRILGLVFGAEKSWPGTLVYIDKGLTSRYGQHTIRIPYDSNVDVEIAIPHDELGQHKFGEDSLVSAYLDIIIDGTMEEEIGGLPVLELLTYSGRLLPCSEGPNELLTYSDRTSQYPYRLSEEYIDWLRSRVGAATFDACVARHSFRVSYKQLEEYKGRMKAANREISQEFFQSGSDVDLVLFKGSLPSMIQRVDPFDLATIGWRRDDDFGNVDEREAARRYWRYAKFDDYPNEVFAVTMDGDILGVFKREVVASV